MPTLSARRKPTPGDRGLAPPDVAKRCFDKLGKVPLGIRQNNAGNLDKGGKPFEGEIVDPSHTGRFRLFRTPEDGIRAIGVLMVNYADRARAKDGSAIDTCDDIISRYAPSSENNTAAYIGQVSRKLGVRPDQKINVYDWPTMRALVCAIVEHENGIMPYSDETIDNGLLRAGIKRPVETVAAERGTDKVLSVTGVAAGGGAAVLSTVVAVLPAAQEAYRQATTSSSLLAEVAPWLPIAFGLLAAGTVVALALRNARLARLVDGRSAA